MAEEDDWRPRLFLGDQAIEGPEVAHDLVPAALIGEMAEIGGGRLGSVTAMIVRVSRVARGIERAGQTGVAGAVLGEAMGDLHDRARRPFRQPTPPQQGLAIVGAKRELAPWHLPPPIMPTAMSDERDLRRRRVIGSGGSASFASTCHLAAKPATTPTTCPSIPLNPWCAQAW